MQQHGRKYLPADRPPPPTHANTGGLNVKIQLFSEHNHVAYFMNVKMRYLAPVQMSK